MCPQSRKFRVGSSRGSSRDAVLENRVRVYRDRVHLNYSKIRVNSSFPRFLSIIDYNSNIEAVLMNRSRKISSSSRLKVLELDIFRDQGQRPRSNSPMAACQCQWCHNGCQRTVDIETPLLILDRNEKGMDKLLTSGIS